jgi:hypothetical protein
MLIVFQESKLSLMSAMGKKVRILSTVGKRCSHKTKEILFMVVSVEITELYFFTISGNEK